jgi:secernin
MGSDMVVALSRSTRDGSTLFGHNGSRPVGEGQALVRVSGRAFERGETVRTKYLILPQAARTHTVLAEQPAGAWGYLHGVNHHGVTAGSTPIRTKLCADSPSLTGPDLVRLVLERAATALQAVDVLTDLVMRYGQGGFAGCAAEDDHDNAFLVADCREAFVVDACGPHWGLQRVGEVRAVTDVCRLRQDWDRLSRGLSDLAIKSGWWPADGSKLDFAGAVGPAGVDSATGLRRWARATLLLEERNGQIDVSYLRRLLSDHHEGMGSKPSPETLCRHPSGPAGECTAASLVIHLGEGEAPVAWCGFGLPCRTVYFPFFLDGSLPEEFQADGRRGGCEVWRWMEALCNASEHDPEVREQLAALQARFDQDAKDFLDEASIHRQHGDTAALQRLATSLMEHNLEAFTAVHEDLGHATKHSPLAAPHGAALGARRSQNTSV